MATDLANPTDEHRMLRELVRSWAEETLEPQAEHHDATESFNLDLLRSLGDMGLLGLTAGLDHGGADMDSVASVIVHEELPRPSTRFRTRVPRTQFAVRQQCGAERFRGPENPVPTEDVLR